MINFKDNRAMVWEVEKHENYTKVKLGTSRKDKKTDEWIGSNWFASFVGNAHKKPLNKGDRIIMDGGVTCEKYQDKYPTKMVVFDFEVTQKAVVENEPDFQQLDDSDSIPF